MADPGQPPKPGAPVPPWAPTPDPNQPTQPGQQPTDETAATMRLIPVPPPTTPPPLPGERYIGKYRVRGELGRGGMGTVYLAEQPGLGREVAIKELIQSADPVALKRYLQEAQVMARTSHPNLVQVHDMELQGNVNYLVLEFVRGRSLRDWISKRPIPPPQVFAVMHRVLQALEYAHRHAIVHRDMKPENVLSSEDGLVKVADFGIARLMDDTGVGGTATKTGTTVGTPQYMSPEQVASSKVDGRSDIYSAGIMFYELVAGQPPFSASDLDGPSTLMAEHVQAPPKPPSVFQPGLTPELEQIILKALAKRPEERFQTGQDFDVAMSRVADQMCPGWRQSLEPGADLSRMVPQATPAMSPSTPIGIDIAQPTSALPQAHVVYNPTPPVKPAARKSASCLSILGVLVLLLATAGALAAGLIR